MIPLFWFRGFANFGDLLSRFLVESVGGDSVRFEERSPKLLALGSILAQARPGDTIWGTGVWREKTPMQGPLRITAVRGPLTRAMLRDQGIECPDVYGDPAILLPRYYRPKIQKQAGITVLPHFRDEWLASDEFHILSPTDEPFSVIDRIASSEILVTSSLHGLIVAEAYGVPVVLLRNSRHGAVEPQFKYADYFASTGRDDLTRFDVPVREAVLTPLPPPVMPDPDRLIAAFPRPLASQSAVPTAPAQARTSVVVPPRPTPRQRNAKIGNSEIEAIFRDACAKHRSGNLNGAIPGYQTVLRHRPRHDRAWHRLGIVHLAQQNRPEAKNCFERAVALRTNNAIYHNNLGVVLQELGDPNAAKQSFSRAIELKPDNADAFANLGLACLLLDELDASKRYLEKAVRLAPNHPGAKRHVIELTMRQADRCAREDRFEDATELYGRAASSSAGRSVWNLKPLGFFPSVFPDEQAIDEHWSRLETDLNVANIRGLNADWRSLPIDGFMPSFNLPHQDRCCRQIREKFASLFAGLFPVFRRSQETKRHAGQRIKIGFIVTSGNYQGFLRVNHLLLRKLNHRRFDTVLLAPAGVIDDCRRVIQNDHVTYVGLSGAFEKTLEILLSLRCDILYHWKIGGSLDDYFLPLLKAAPIQCTSLGTLGTSGMKAVDYYVSSALLEYEGSERHYTEKLVRLNSFPTIHPLDPPVAPVTRRELGLPEQGAIYFCPHRLPKYHPRFDEYLKRILEEDATGHLLLLAGSKRALSDRMADRMERNLGETLMRRVHLLTSLPRHAYRDMLSLSTCVLDSPVYAGDLTTHDALQLGVPVVTQPGPLLVQNYTAGLYRLAEIDGLSASDPEHYVRIAVRLGTDSEFRQSMSQTIQERKPALFGVTETVRDYERFFEQAFASHERWTQNMAELLHS